MDDLNNGNYILFAAKYYWSVHYTTKEFSSDLKRISYIKRLLRKYVSTGNISERLVLNHLILLFNVFTCPKAVQRLLFLKMDNSCYSALKTFLIYLNRMPDELIINNKKIILTGIPVDLNIAKFLREL